MTIIVIPLHMAKSVFMEKEDLKNMNEKYSILLQCNLKRYYGMPLNCHCIK